MNAVVVHQHDVSEIERMARAIAVSGLFGVTKPEQAITLCLIAQAEGRHPASAAQDYHIIQGKPSKKADAMLRDFINAGGKVQWHTLDDTIADATFSHPSGGSVRISWDMARAMKAKLATDMWKKYPRQMLRARVVSEGVRTVFPMATSGMYVPEEVQEFDAPKPERQAQQTATIEATVNQPSDIFAKAELSIRDAKTEADLRAAWKAIEVIPEADLPQSEFDRLNEQCVDRLATLRAAPADDDAFPGDMAPVDPNAQFDRMERVQA